MDIVRMSGLWSRKKQDGETFLVGTVGAFKFLVFRNKYKQGDNEPDYYLCVAQNVEKEPDEQPVEE